MGGALYLDTASGAYNLTNVTLTNNRAYASTLPSWTATSLTSFGGGLSCTGDAGRLTQTSVTYSGNSAVITGGSMSSLAKAQGGGFYLESGSTILTSCNLTNNLASGYLVRATDWTLYIAGAFASATGPRETSRIRLRAVRA